MLMIMSSRAPGRCDTIELTKTAGRKGQGQHISKHKITQFRHVNITSRPNSVTTAAQPTENRSNVKPQTTERYGTHPTITDNLDEIADKEVHFLSLALVFAT